MVALGNSFLKSPFRDACHTVERSVGRKTAWQPCFLSFPPQAVKLLLDMGSDINAQIETNRNTALTLACFQGRHEVVSLLLDRRANVEHRAKTGEGVRVGVRVGVAVGVWGRGSGGPSRMTVPAQPMSPACISPVMGVAVGVAVGVYLG